METTYKQRLFISANLQKNINIVGNFVNLHHMTKTAYVTIVVLAILWGWLAWGVLKNGITLYSLLIVAMAGIIIFVPVWRKYHKNK